VVEASATGPWKEVFEGAAADSEEEGAIVSAQAKDGDIESDGAWLSLVVRSLTGRETHLRVRPAARMGSVFAEFARRMGAPHPGMFRFVFHGRSLEDDSDATPSALGIQDGDRILAVIRARGC
jgi:Ubiquitin-2 like Rad60 SUMO-like